MTIRPASRVLGAFAGAALLLAPGPSVAEMLYPLGDGSGTNNADLIRDPAAGCENCQIDAPHEWDAPPFSLDWSLSLRGAYVEDKNGSHFEAIAAPSVAFKHDYLRGTYSLNGSAEVSRSTVEDVRVRSLRLGATGTFEVNTAISVNGAANLALLTPSASSQGYPTDTASASQELSGDATVSATYDWGHLTTTLRGTAERSVYGPTRLVDGTEIDNSANNNWRAAGGLRVGYKVTPLLTAFIDGSIGHQFYDLAAPTYGARLDATDYALRGGIAAKWSEVLEGEASVGVGLRNFTYGVAPDVVSQLYDASLTFRPDETLTLRGGLATTVGEPGPNGSGVAKVEYAATADVAYRVNPWLTLRGNAAYRHATFAGSPSVETGYGLGAGADYLLNEHMTLTGDYSYASTTEAPADTTETEHRVTLGLTFKR